MITVFPRGKPSSKLSGRASEHSIQKAIAQYLLTLELQGKLIFFAVPNGGQRHIAVATKLKSEGVRAGIPDIVVLSKGKTFFLEIKTARGYLSESQKAFFNAFDAQGINCAVVRSVDNVEDILAEWSII